VLYRETLPVMKTLQFLVLVLAVAVPLRAADLPDTSYPTSDRQSLRINMTVKPAFPQHLIANGVNRGETRVLISVSHQGVLVDSLVVAYTDKAFADAVLDVLERWRYEPMLVRGQAVPCQVELLISFEATGVVVSLDVNKAISRLTNRPEEIVFSPCGLRELDQIPRPVQADSPIFPKWLRDSGIHGNVTVEFYIDEKGAVRMPAVLAADHEELGFLAVDAVRGWRFDAPTRNGRPVLAKVRQLFHFGPSES